jgi:kynurenine formamidase
MNLNLPAGKLIDISLPLDARTFHMRTYSGFKKDMQFDVEVIKAYEDGGYGQIVRGAHMRLHAGTHIDAPSHMIKGAPDLQDVPLQTYFGDAIIADVRHRGGGEAITPADLEKAVGDIILPGDRLLLRTDQNQQYDGSPEWMKRAPYVNEAATNWCIEKRIALIGFDFYHGATGPDEDEHPVRVGDYARAGIITMPYICNLDRITKRRVTLMAFPLNIIGVEASPVRAIVIEH